MEEKLFVLSEQEQLFGATNLKIICALRAKDKNVAIEKIKTLLNQN